MMNVVDVLNICFMLLTFVLAIVFMFSGTISLNSAEPSRFSIALSRVSSAKQYESVYSNFDGKYREVRKMMNRGLKLSNLRLHLAFIFLLWLTTLVLLVAISVSMKLRSFYDVIGFFGLFFISIVIWMLLAIACTYFVDFLLQNSNRNEYLISLCFNAAFYMHKAGLRQPDDSDYQIKLAELDRMDSCRYIESFYFVKSIKRVILENSLGMIDGIPVWQNKVRNFGEARLVSRDLQFALDQAHGSIAHGHSKFDVSKEGDVGRFRMESLRKTNDAIGDCFLWLAGIYRNATPRERTLDQVVLRELIKTRKSERRRRFFITAIIPFSGLILLLVWIRFVYPENGWGRGIFLGLSLLVAIKPVITRFRTLVKGDDNHQDPDLDYLEMAVRVESSTRQFK